MRYSLIMARLLLFAGFFASGFGSLVHEVVWQRYLVTLFGGTVYATSTLLFLFMANLAVGAFLAPRLLARYPYPALLYLACEVGIALYGLSSPLLFLLVHLLDGLLPYSAPWVHLLFRFFLSALFLSFPLVLMGASYPFFCALFSNEPHPSRSMAYAYGLNTFGGASGTLAAGFLLIKTVGLSGCQLVASLANLGAGLVVYWLGKGKLLPKKSKKRLLGSSEPIGLYAVVFLSGFLGLWCEVVFTRVLVNVFGSTVYAFSLLLFSYLLGLFAGSLSASHLPPKRASLLLGHLFLTGGLFLYLAIFSLGESSRLLFSLLLTTEGSRLAYHLCQLVVALVSVFPSAFLFGALFGTALCLKQQGDVFRAGALYGANSLGSATGAVAAVAGIALLGYQGSLYAATGMMLLAGLAWGWQKEWRQKLAPLGIVTVMLCLALFGFRPRLDRQALVRGTYEVAANMLSLRKLGKPVPAGELWREKGELAYYKEGLQTTVAVLQSSEQVFLKLNGRTNASTGRDMVTQLFLSYVPLLLHPDPKAALVIGMGSGVSLRAVAQFPLPAIDLVEIEPGVLEAARYFQPVNWQADQDPRVALIVDDARHFLARAGRTYDIIVSEPSHPWFGSNSLFTREFYQTVYQQLNAGGVFSQWIASYDLSKEATQAAIRTFLAVFAESSLFTPLMGDLVLIGRKSAAPIPFEQFAARMQKSRIGKELRAFRLEDPLVFLSATFLLDGKALRDYAGVGPLNLDRFPLLEFAGADGLLQAALAMENHRALIAKKKSLFPRFLQVDERRLTRRHLFALALAKMRQERTEEAVSILKSLRQAEPKWAEVLHTLGQAYVMLGDFRQAKEAYEQVVELLPGSPYAWYDLSLCYRALGMRVQAEGAMEKAKKLKPDIQGPTVTFPPELMPPW